ncbi:uncharacterized protein LOC135375274 [Ornithodoros turicata]|uniref:uncharacterized protein LOC135375274 n=1 Tax=Ornithodoros turicata TaxID=34597 RepID=UPI003139C73F
MKVVIASLMLLALLNHAACDCQEALSELGSCADNIQDWAPLKDMNFEAVRTHADKEKVACCALKYMDNCVDVHLGTECPQYLARAKATTLNIFRKSLGSDVTCTATSAANCEQLPSLFSF